MFITTCKHLIDFQRIQVTPQLKRSTRLLWRLRLLGRMLYSETDVVLGAYEDGRSVDGEESDDGGADRHGCTVFRGRRLWPALPEPFWQPTGADCLSPEAEC